MKLKEREKLYKESQKQWRAKIKQEPNRWKRFWKWVWYLIAFPFIWVWQNFRDWRTILIFVISMIVVAGSVWIFYLLAFIYGTNTDTGKWLLGIGSAVWVWWISPVGSPYILICISITIGVKALFDAIRSKREKRKENSNYERKQIDTQKQSTD